MNIIDGFRAFGERVSPRARARRRAANAAAEAHYEQYVQGYTDRKLRRQVAKRFQQQTGYRIQWNPSPMADLANLSFEEMNKLVLQRRKAQQTSNEER